MASSRLKDLLEFLSVNQSQAGAYSEEELSKLLDACLTDFLLGPKVPMAEGTTMAKMCKKHPYHKRRARSLHASMTRCWKTKAVQRKEEKPAMERSSTVTCRITLPKESGMISGLI